MTQTSLNFDVPATPPVVPVTMSQSAVKFLEAMKDGPVKNSVLIQIDAVRYRSVCSELRDKGFNVIAEKVDGSWYYRLEGK